MKQLNKKLLAISLVIILLPSIFGAIMWNKLADEIAIHWGITGEADGFAKSFLFSCFMDHSPFSSEIHQRISSKTDAFN